MARASKTAPPPRDDAGPGDGRRARGARARTAVVEALLSLIQEGDLRPTAPRIADRAGVSRRLLFHHFADLDDLYRALSEVQGQRVLALFEPIDQALPVEDRLARFVAQRVRLLEYITPFRRAARLQEPDAPALAEGLARMRGFMRVQVQTVFAAELAALPAERDVALAAVGAAAGFSLWENLRLHQSLSRADATAALTYLLRAALGLHSLRPTGTK